MGVLGLWIFHWFYVGARVRLGVPNGGTEKAVGYREEQPNRPRRKSTEENGGHRK